MHATLSIEVRAPARLVFDLARDVERWPSLLPHYLSVRATQRHDGGAVTARMVAVRPIVPLFGYGVPVAWRARTWAEPTDLRLRFVHIGGATDGMDVTWRIEPTETGCRVSIDHELASRVPGWPGLLNRLFVVPIATRTLATFKAIAEAVGESAKAGAGDTDETAATGPAKRPRRRRSGSLPPANPSS